ncbi:MAG: aspartate/glutamate racemase family protein [Actinomycetaceae bacterium]|nr:aspartate/glutamate racemase family protein [Actinomycetaceae bacterium]
MQQTKILGIIGGVGPLATWDLAKQVTHFTQAETDQEHIRILIDSNTSIPDRTQAILHGGPSPVPQILESARLLEKAGADFLAMPCNTGHYYHAEVAQAIDIPFLHMIDEVGKELQRQGAQHVAVLATDGTRQTDIYADVLARHGVQTFYPDDEWQKFVVSIIYDYVKAGNMDFPEQRIRALVEELHSQGAEKIVLGCTELPVAFDAIGLRENIVSATDVLAKAIVLTAGKQIRL